MTWLNSKATPSSSDLFLASPASKYYWINREAFYQEKDLLWRKLDNSGTPTSLLVIPKSMKSEVMDLNHCIPASGHQGIIRTKAKIREKYFWYGMSADIHRFIASCEVCAKSKKPVRHARYQLTKFHAGSPMERVHLDFLGPLMQTTRGNQYILMMVDQFTKWVECIPLPSQTAEQTAQAAVGEFFARFGYPFEICTDQGPNFESRLFSAICDVLHIHKTRTTPYRPSANGQVERMNRCLMDAVRCFVNKSQKDWDVYLSQIAGALRSSVNRNTGFTPNKLMLGREVNQPSDLMFGLSAESADSHEGYVRGLEDAITTAHQVARDTLKTTQERMKRDYDLRVNMYSYNIGDCVYLLQSAIDKGKSRKLSQPWKGPGIIINKLTPYLYKVKFQRAIVTSNHDRLKLCRDRELPPWIIKFKANLSRHKGKTSVSHVSQILYCICRKPYHGEFMIQCDTCYEWYHGLCVGVRERDARKIRVYTCPVCA